MKDNTLLSAKFFKSNALDYWASPDTIYQTTIPMYDFHIDDNGTMVIEYEEKTNLIITKAFISVPSPDENVIDGSTAQAWAAIWDTGTKILL